jgi:three-Cys-motif partner protein
MVRKLVALSDPQWLKEKLKFMINKAEAFKSINPGVYYETGAWSTIKLMTILNYVPIYTRIIPHHFDSMYYIELLAGTGLCKIKETHDIVAGSALIAATVCHAPFDEYILIEKDEKRAKALEKRMKTLTPNVKVLQQDCNECIKEVVDRLPDGCHYLAFIDCEGLDADWSTMDYLLSKPGDLLFTFQSQFVARVRGKAVKGSKGDEDKLNKFYGNGRWKDCKTTKELVSAYMNKLNEKRGIVLPIYVQGPRGYRYYVIYATKKTRKGSPWVKGVFYLKKRIEGCDYKWVKGILNVLTGRQLLTSMCHFGFSFNF